MYISAIGVRSSMQLAESEPVGKLDAEQLPDVCATCELVSQ